MLETNHKALIEALLFASPQPLAVETLCQVTSLPGEEVRESLAALAAEYAGGGRGMALEEVAGGWQFRTRPEFAPQVLALRQARARSRFSRSALETLAIIAYRQPVQRAELEGVRGVDCGAVLKGLLAQGMVRILGRKEAPGRPILYGTSEEFLRYFSLRDLESLPTLEEVRELDEGMEPPPPERGPEAAARAALMEKALSPVAVLGPTPNEEAAIPGTEGAEDEEPEKD